MSAGSKEVQGRSNTLGRTSIITNNAGIAALAVNAFIFVYIYYYYSYCERAVNFLEIILKIFYIFI